MSYYNTELYHYGVLGMKWRVRRYADENGRLNAAGKNAMEYLVLIVGRQKRKE